MSLWPVEKYRTGSVVQRFMRSCVDLNCTKDMILLPFNLFVYV